MPIVSFKKVHKSFEVREGENLMKALLEQNIPVASSCYSKGICTKCRIQVIEGPENLSKPNALEKLDRERLANSKSALKDDERLSCQSRVLGDIKIDTGYW